MTMGSSRYLGNEFLDFAENLKLSQFKSIGPGIGLGQVRDRVPGARVEPTPAGMPAAIVYGREEATAQASTRAFDPSQPTVAHVTPARRSVGGGTLTKALMGFGVDLVLFLTTTSFLVTAIVAGLTFWRPDVITSVSASPVGLWFQQLWWLKLALVSTAGYLLFWGLFRILLGRSLGDTLVFTRVTDTGDGF